MRSRSAEAALLAPVDQLIDAALKDLGCQGNLAARLEILEGVAAVHGGWPLLKFWRRLGRQPRLRTDTAIPWAEKVLTRLSDTEIPIPLALAALSREPLTATEMRTTGAYYTDWRLAQLLARQAVPGARFDLPWIDPACGSGVLLAAAALVVPAGTERDRVIAGLLIGADLSRNALRAALLSVASTTASLDAVTAFAQRLVCQDSLSVGSRWSTLLPAGAGLVIMNPPWEKLRVTRHEAALHSGVERHYGQAYADNVDVSAHRSQLLEYVARASEGTRLQGSGEPDLYKLFVELGLGLTGAGGTAAALVPAGLIRAQGTELLRRELLACTRRLDVSVIENRQRHFAIDTRFKFCAIVGQVGDGRRGALRLRVADRSGALPAQAVSMSRAELARVRSDLSIPEVRTQDEWELYRRLAETGVRIGDPDGPWHPRYRREVDMTRDATFFLDGAGSDGLPVIEGRHVHQFRACAKAYREGQGRAAIWEPLDISTAELVPQWRLKPSVLRPAARRAIERSRIGFCDITGQTNERSLLAARIPAGVVCGNKVPTLELHGGPDAEDLLLALLNSFAVDWMLRRIVTTSVNFFLLDSLVLPPVSVDSAPGQQLISLTRGLTAAEGSRSAEVQTIAENRARIDTLVAHAWGLTRDDLATVFADFPLLDRGQPPLEGEGASTITRDLVLAAFDGVDCDRTARAVSRGAHGYVPADYATRSKVG